ncbi:phage tail tape measure protein [Lactobacillus crispatus]|uniref:phage tail tape measure protein n=3 Tax=Lactobacillus crispatus TaxID=47770 RepID=UPI0018DE0930|nr:phage tail tape measure protein [Lactobacillus crispatus]MBH9539019.1 phage tail tape measure protein [Lactobacillus crispatus]MCZ3559117.1 phage tail tape measure protein [Lactobacillus crispatus]MCZ3561256.1 phage tail tape measure protein [Lactobacillus crispatus]MCZ3563408.1 phage tail tape measure protein [Lactobacillus crispatus]MCZ3565428.1 phage tail tape measure protein [Lactobacillus crispatus]
MADIEHLGIGINTNVEYNSLKEAEKTTRKFISDLGVLEKRFDRLKAPDFTEQFNRNKNSVEETSRTVAGLKKQLGGMATESGQTTATVKKHLEETKNSTNRLIDANVKLKSSIAGVGGSAKTMGGLSNTIWKAGVSANTASGGFNTAKDAVEKTNGTLKNNRSASDRATTGFNLLHDAGSKLITVGTGIAAAMVPVAAAFKNANDEATKLADEYNVIKNLQQTGGDSAATAKKNTAAIQRENRNLSLKYGVDQNSLAQGSEELIRRGYSGNQDLAAHKYFVQAAKATKEDYNSVVNAAAPMLEQFGYKKRAGNSTKKMARYTREVLNKAAYVGDVTSGQVGGEGGFGNSFKMAGSILHQTGQSLSSSLAALGTLSNFGEEGTSAGTGLRQIVSSLVGASKSKTKTAALRDLGLSPADFFTKSGNLKQLPTVFNMLNRATQGKKSNRVTGDFKQLFGQTGFNDALILTRNNRDVANNVRAANRADSTNYISNLSNKNMSSLQNQLSKTKMLLKDMGMQFAQQIAPVLANMLKFVNKVLRAIEGWPAPVKKTLGYITAITGALSTGFIAKRLVGNVLRIGGKTVAKTAAKGAGESASPSLLGGTGSLIGKVSSNLIGGKFAKTGLGQKTAGLLGGTASKGASALAVGGIALNSGIDLYKAITTKNPKKKFENYGKSIGSAIGGGVGLYLGGPAGAAIGSTLGQVAGKWAGDMARRFSKTKFGKSVGKTFKQAAWSIKTTWHDAGISKMISGTVKSVKRSFGSMTRDIGRDWRDLNRNKAFRNFKNFLKSGLMSSLKLAIKQGATVIKTGIGVVRGAVKIVTSNIKGIVKISSGVVRTISDIFHWKWGKAWKDMKGVAKSAIDMVTGMLSGLKDMFSSVIGGIASSVKNVWDFVSGKDWKTKKPENSTSVASANKSVKAMQNGQGGKHHASKSHATTIADINRSTHLGAHANGTASLVGEAGPELAYKPYSNHARLLGAKGPQLANIQSGEKILNARDTAKVMSGGLGAGLKLKGYANGNASLGKTTKKVTDDYKQIASKSSKSLNDLTKKSNSSWRKITSTTTKQAQKSRKGAIDEYTHMRTGVHKQMDKMHDGVVDLASTTAKGFGKELGHMTKYAHSAMGDTIDQVNSGIKGIDQVLGQFGGNTSVIKPVKFAKGSNGRLSQNTMAMVNDATIGPRQEAIIKNSGDIWIPRGNNRILPLEKGDSVLNGSQTQELANYWGLQRFAKGSGVSHSRLRKIAETAGNNPAKSFADMYTSKIKASGTDLRQGSINLARNSSTKLGNPWSNAMWAVINNAIGGANGKGGTREGFLKYAESTFSGVKYQMGAASKTLSDCSGMVMQALRHFGVDIGRTTVAMQHSSGVEYLGKSLSKTIPGDLVIFGHGTGAAGHVGIIKNPHTGTMFNETPPHARVTSIADDKGMGYGYYRVRGLHNAAQSKKTAAADKNLMALAKKELGSTALGWIKKNLSDDLGSLGSFSIGGDLAERAKALAGGLKKLDPKATKNGIAAVLGNWNFESGGLNPGAVNNSGGASGLGQWLGGRKSNLIAYARRHGASWKNAGTQLSFAVKGEGSDSAILRSVLEGTGSVASLANKFSSEWERGGYNAQHVKGAMEIRKVLGYAKGGDPVVGNKVLVGEHGPELAEFKDPVHIYSNEKTRQRLKPLTSSKPKVRPVRGTGGALGGIQVTVNINGNVDGDDAKLQKLAKMIGVEVDQQVRQKLNIILDHIGNDTGDDDDFL